MYKTALPAEPPLPDVPPRQIVDFDFFAVQPVDGDLHRAWKHLDDGPDVFHTPRNGGAWTRTADALAIYADVARFSNAGVAMSGDARDMPLALGETDPPEHTGFRTLLNALLGPKPICEFEAEATRISHHSRADRGISPERRLRVPVCSLRRACRSTCSCG